jgi:hypothetical protein
MPRRVHNCRWHRIREGTVSSFAFAYRDAKVRINEQNAKGKLVFLLVVTSHEVRKSFKHWQFSQ